MSGFAHAFASGLILPVICIVALGWIVPRLLALVMPEGVRPLIALGLLAALILMMLSSGAFLLLYLMRGVPLAALFADGLWPGTRHFLHLGLLSVLFWGPIMLLSVAGLPKTWTKVTW
ncbi:MAG: hypothetical protein GC146_10505 [Limimaricola sp.]|uniref:hypothetical protein n=1 Tax=Limimaricola sp. TaxID=2211665 RepID=UPI001D1B4A0B|nr:hypothetical protein [Limimaricola sp.]MBI1417641.1 hypothetical protein [Limimaricola sp.]